MMIPWVCSHDDTSVQSFALELNAFWKLFKWTYLKQGSTNVTGNSKRKTFGVSDVLGTSHPCTVPGSICRVLSQSSIKLINQPIRVYLLCHVFTPLLLSSCWIPGPWSTCLRQQAGRSGNNCYELQARAGSPGNGESAQRDHCRETSAKHQCRLQWKLQHYCQSHQHIQLAMSPIKLPLYF